MSKKRYHIVTDDDRPWNSRQQAPRNNRASPIEPRMTAKAKLAALIEAAGEPGLSREQRKTLVAEMETLGRRVLIERLGRHAGRLAWKRSRHPDSPLMQEVRDLVNRQRRTEGEQS